MAYIKSLPINDTPEIFGLHDNANITFAQNETFNMLGGLLLLQPKSSSGGGMTREEVCNGKNIGNLKKLINQKSLRKLKITVVTLSLYSLGYILILNIYCLNK